MLKKFLRRLWQPPRAHGDVIEDRTVSFLELFYDLVYVVVIAGASSALAHHMTIPAIIEFVVIFSLIWLAWLNGTTYYDAHGREDIRTRFYTFVQMALLVPLAVYVGEAVTGGPEFALIYAAFMALLWWLWFTVYRIDRREKNVQATGAQRYLVLMTITVIAMIISAFQGGEGRLIIWTLLVVMWLVAAFIMLRNSHNFGDGVAFVHSTVERFDLFTIIVLGEVVVGVVEGLSDAHKDGLTLVTAFFALIIGFGLWWNYFDWVGRRLPRTDIRALPIWIHPHLPLSMSIVGAGASMISIIEHATESHAPLIASGLLSGSVAIGLLSLVLIMWSLDDYERLKALYRPTMFVMVIGAGIALLIGIWRPRSLILVVSLTSVLSLIWAFGIWRWMQVTEDESLHQEAPENGSHRHPSVSAET